MAGSCTLAFFTVCSAAAWGRSNSYKVHLNFNRPLQASVEAQLDAPDGVIFSAHHAGGYAWWDFIKKVRERLDDGSSVPLQAVGDGRWLLPAGAAGPVRLTYDVDLSFQEKLISR